MTKFIRSCIATRMAKYAEFVLVPLLLTTHILGGNQIAEAYGGDDPVDPSFSNPKAPTMEDICKRELKTDSVFMEEADKYNCKTIRCLRPGDDGKILIQSIAPVENVVCGGEGRCFRGVCRHPGYMFRNEGSGLCMTASNPFEFTAPANMIACPSDGTPLQRFVLTTSDNGFNLGTPFTLIGNKESGDKCLYTGNKEGGIIWTDRCNAGNPWHGWDVKEVAGNFLLSHRVTGRCAKPRSRDIGSYVETLGNCNANDPDMLWTRYI